MTLKELLEKTSISMVVVLRGEGVNWMAGTVRAHQMGLNAETLDRDVVGIWAEENELYVRLAGEAGEGAEE